jgi:hypothetical protein
MTALIARFSNDERGLMSIEYGLLAAVIGIGIIVALPKPWAPKWPRHAPTAPTGCNSPYHLHCPKAPALPRLLPATSWASLRSAACQSTSNPLPFPM